MCMTYKNALVTGGAGFIGSHVVDALVAQGVVVTVVDKVDPLPDRKNIGATYVRIDINDEKIGEVFHDAAPDVVFHLAAHVDDRASVLDPVFNAQENILGTLNVCEAARKAGVKKIVFASTGVVYGKEESLEPTNESVVPRPQTPYAVSKLAGERYLHFYSTMYGIPYVALRLANVYGPRQDGSKECGVIAIATSRLFAGKEVFLHNDGLTTRDYVFVGDVVTAMLAAAEKDVTGVMNIGTGVGTSTKDVCEKVFAAMHMPLLLTPKPDVDDAVKHVALDSTKAKAGLDWSPRVRVDDGIAETISWYEKV